MIDTFTRVETPEPTRAEIRDTARKFKLEYGVARRVMREALEGEWYRNDTYTVIRKEAAVSEHWPAMWHLSIKRNDRRPFHDWRVVQQIKNMIVGPEHEGVELFPAESRVVDTANQYHLWVLKEGDMRFPFGFEEGIKTEDTLGQSEQRPFDSA